MVIGPDYPGAGPDFVGFLRDAVSYNHRPGAVTVFLQGAAGDALPLEAFRDDDGAEVAADVFGQRVALEAAHAIADADPWPVEFDRSDWGSVTPISLYRRRVADDPPGQPLRTARRIVSLPLLDLPSVADLERELAERKADLVARGEAGETRVTMNPIRYHISWLETTLAQEAAGGRATAVDGEAIWAARIGDCAIVGAPGEIFVLDGTAVRAASPAPVTIFAGYSQGSLGDAGHAGRIPARRRRRPTVSHRGYGQPAPFSTEVAGIIERTALELLQELFVLTGQGTKVSSARADLGQAIARGDGLVSPARAARLAQGGPAASLLASASAPDDARGRRLDGAQGCRKRDGARREDARPARSDRRGPR